MLILAGPMAVALSCAPTAGEPEETVVSEEPAFSADYVEGDPSAAVDRELELVDPQDLELGFCRDDIYARYLIKQYEADRPLGPRLKRFRSRRSRDRARRDHEYDALHFANRKLNGEVSDYFGAIPVVANEKVEFWINHFKKRGRRDFMRWLVRGESMKPLVFPVLREHGIPQEFFYLAMVESGFNHSAYSRARATGTWQFMHGTAKIYGLKINHWVDERRDPLRSTVAAATFLRDLYGELGDWHLAMAAYNAGPGRVRGAIRRAKTRDFWTIADGRYLAVETRQYVPKVLAAILLAANPKAHGFEVTANPADSIPETSVHIDRPVSLTDVARELGVSRQTLSRWNPEIIREITPPGANGYDLRLPPEQVQLFASISGRLPYLEVTDVHMYKIKSGDTLSQIARRYRVKTQQILSLNPQLRAKTLRIGKSIAIPVPGVVTRKDAT